MALDENQQRTLELLRKRQAKPSEIRRALEPLPTEQEPRDLGELTLGVISRPTFVGAGSVIGTAVGAGAGLATGPAAPAVAPVTALGAGALGAAAGSALFDNLNNLAFQAGLVTQPATTLEIAETAATEGLLDFSTGAFFQVFRPNLIRRAIMGRIFGVSSPEAKRAARLAELAGISVDVARRGQPKQLVPAVGAADIGGKAPKIISKALGVFPITGRPAERNLLAKQSVIRQRLDETLDLLAPNSLLRNAAGIDITLAASKRFDKFRSVAGKLYDRAFTAMSKAVDANGKPLPIVPTTETKKAATDLATAISEGQIQLLTGDTLEPVVRDRVGEFAAQLQNLPDNLTGPEFKGLVRQFRNLLDEIEVQAGKNLSFREATLIKDALEADFRNLSVSQVGADLAEEIISAQRAADSFYSKALARFETVTGKKLGRVDLNIFGAGPFRAGTLNADEALDVALNLRSAQAVKELGDIIGPRGLRQAGRAVIERAVQLSTETVNIGGLPTERLNPRKLLNILGTGAKRGTEEGLEALLKSANVDVAQFREVLKVAEQLQDVADPSTFVTRRVILGGAGAAAGALGAGAGLAAGAGIAGAGLGGLTTAAALTVLSRRLVDIATSPESLKLMQTALDEAATTATRRKALGAILVALGRQSAEQQRIKEAQTRRERQTRFRLGEEASEQFIGGS